MFLKGWEFAVEATIGGYSPVEHTYHLCRRRRWVRMRTFIKDLKVTESGESDLIGMEVYILYYLFIYLFIIIIIFKFLF